MALAKKGVDVRETSGHLMFRALLQDGSGSLVTSGTTLLYLYEVQSDGTLKSYDWNDNTFKATALTTETQSLTHRTGNNSTTNTGIWTYALTTLTGFTVGGIYLARVKNTLASPNDQVREFQFGGAESDFLAPTSTGRYSSDMTALDGDATAATNQRRAALAIARGTVGSGSTTTSIVTTGTTPTASKNDQFKNRVVIFDSDTTTAELRNQAALISANTTGGAATITVSTLTDAPVSGDTFGIY